MKIRIIIGAATFLIGFGGGLLFFRETKNQGGNHPIEAIVNIIISAGMSIFCGAGIGGFAGVTILTKSWLLGFSAAIVIAISMALGMVLYFLASFGGKREEELNDDEFDGSDEFRKMLNLD